MNNNQISFLLCNVITITVILISFVVLDRQIYDDNIIKIFLVGGGVTSLIVSVLFHKLDHKRYYIILLILSWGLPYFIASLIDNVDGREIIFNYFFPYVYFLPFFILYLFLGVFIRSSFFERLIFSLKKWIVSL